MNNFTPHAMQVLAIAQEEAISFHHSYIGTEHLLLGLFRKSDGVALAILKSLGLDIETLRFKVEDITEKHEVSAQAGQLPYSTRLQKILALAAKEAKTMDYSYIGTEHLLLAILEDEECAASKILTSLNVDVPVIKREISMTLDSNFLPTKDDFEPINIEPFFDVPDEQLPDALHTFGRDLTELAKQGDLDPVIGRVNEIERVIQVLCRRTKNNPVLIGEAGVGKTAIVEGLAHAIVLKSAPDILQDKIVICLDLSLMIAGTKYRGQFEERLKTVLDEIKTSANVIVFIDELHTIVGAGSAEGTMDAANILKPALARGELQCIGATTMDEYRKHIEKDSALERRFQPIMVNPPTAIETVKILNGLKANYEKHHHVEYTDAALIAAAKLSDRYISGRFLPDKAIDVMDEAGARTKLTAAIPQPDTKTLTKKLEKLKKVKSDAIADQKFEEAAKARDNERKIKAKIDAVIKSWEHAKKTNIVKIGEKEITEIIARLTGIPIQQMEKEENTRLLKMEEILAKDVIGQEAAIQTISQALRRSRADLKDPKRPIASFLFLGPTGVGKTLLAKLLAEFIFGDPDAIIQLDMSEYMEKFNVSRLVGSPPGYIGHDEGGQLSESVRRRPYSIVLFDEIDKAHPDVVHMLLQIVEEGKLTDSVGRKIDFRNTIIIMTSNLGAHKIIQGKELGFASKKEADDFEKNEKKLLELAKKHFKPEFINRVDEVIVFRKLTRKDLRKIIKLEVDKVMERLVEKDFHLVLNNDVLDFLIDAGYEPDYGARPLRRAIERHIENPLSEEILKGALSSGKKIKVEVDEKKLAFSQPNN